MIYTYEIKGRTPKFKIGDLVRTSIAVFRDLRSRFLIRTNLYCLIPLTDINIFNSTIACPLTKEGTSSESTHSNLIG